MRMCMACIGLSRQHSHDLLVIYRAIAPFLSTLHLHGVKMSPLFPYSD
ncbi:hypothetical protein NB703_001613 [Pantoea ananatis]|uniref:Uncharacterized protein n=1 Tax=Pantoea ananas TaxID=553 RepID=A0AAJ1CXL9_PANAN|nr:hypothetical protein [Pantoea ananatis]MCW0343520.1 hypothetical protein [Pantoea ananatis]